MWGGRKMPGCVPLPLWSDPYLECLARHYTNTIYHHSGSARYVVQREAAFRFHLKLTAGWGAGETPGRWWTPG